MGIVRLSPTLSISFLLKNPQEFHLCMKRNFTDFIQKNAAFVRRLEAPHTISVRAGKRTFYVPEELAFQKGFIQSGAIDHDKRLVLPGASFMNGVSRQLLSCSAFPVYNYRCGRSWLNWN